MDLRKESLSAVAYITTSVFILGLFVPSVNCGTWGEEDEDLYNFTVKNDSDRERKERWLIVFVVLFFGLGALGACIACYCRYCSSGANTIYGQPVRYLGHGVYIPEGTIAQRMFPLDLSQHFGNPLYNYESSQNISEQPSPYSFSQQLSFVQGPQQMRNIP